MIKIANPVRRLPRLSREEFLRYWFEHHAPLVRELAPILRIRRYVQSNSFSDPRLQPALEARASRVEMYDGVAELWWDSVDDIVAVAATPEGRAASQRLSEDERNFIDIENSMRAS